MNEYNQKQVQNMKKAPNAKKLTLEDTEMILQARVLDTLNVPQAWLRN